jgi:hypothetical protein
VETLSINDLAAKVQAPAREMGLAVEETKPLPIQAGGGIIANLTSDKPISRNIFF